MTNEKDLVRSDDELGRYVLRVIRGCATDDQYIETLERVKSALATVRGEEREAAFKDAIEIAKAEAFERRMAYCVVDALEAALTEKIGKGEG